jgi:hypothetical protein
MPARHTPSAAGSRNLKRLPPRFRLYRRRSPVLIRSFGAFFAQWYFSPNRYTSTI